MMRILTLVCIVFCVAACGVKRPLMRPGDVPAYEEKRAKEREKYEPNSTAKEQAR